jgi:hypothetical protein
MSNNERQALIDEANELGLEFAKNTTDKKLRAIIAEAKGEPTPIDEEPVENPVRVKEEAEEEDLEEVVVPAKVAALREKANLKRSRIAANQAEAMKTRIVTITNRDSRDNTYTTTALLSMENQYFSISKIVPLDIAVELEDCLIKVAQSTMIPHHTDEIVNGRRTGNKITKQAKKYTISYSDENPE